MAAITRTYTFSDGNTAYGSQVETEISTLVTAWNNHNAGTSTWTVVSALNASAVPLIADNSSGTNDIAQFKDNGTAVVSVNDGGNVSFSVAGKGIILKTPDGNQTWLVRLDNEGGLVTDQVS